MSSEDGWDTIDERDTVLKCSSGYVFEHVNCGIIGLSKWKPTTVYAGYDGTLFAEYYRDMDLGEKLPSNQDLVELGDFMIEQWKCFRAYWQGRVEGENAR